MASVNDSGPGYASASEAVGPISSPGGPRWSVTAVPGPPWLRWVVGVALVVLLAWLVWRFLWPHPQPKHVVPALPVAVAEIATGDMQVVLQGLGTVTPVATITVQSQISGQLVGVGFKEGQVVRKGQFLDQIDDRPYRAALAQAEGALTHDLGLLNQAQSDLARYLVLDRQNSIAKQTVTDQQFLVAQDQGTVMEDRANIQTARLNIAYCHIVSPVTGRVGLRLVDAGNYVSSGAATGLVVVTQLQPITMIFVLPENDIPEVSAQLSGGASLAVEAYDQSNEKLIAPGALTTLDNTVDTTTGTVKLRAIFPNADFALFPNEFVNARMVLRTLANVLEVPVRAVQYGAPGSFVYVLQPNQTVSVRVIKTGVTEGDMMQVLSGLSPGDKVVVDGVSLLRQGAKVRVTPEQAVPSAGVNPGPGAPPGEQPQNAAPVPNGQKGHGGHRSQPAQG